MDLVNVILCNTKQTKIVLNFSSFEATPRMESGSFLLHKSRNWGDTFGNIKLPFLTSLAREKPRKIGNVHIENVLSKFFNHPLNIRTAQSTS